mmetsp:Transcript_8971/g.24160  ORF Transcript_8971/g.24160 Transcript_8971/m.24160 type:complete len:407 (-) Transcript_8971:3069-4289(-)
MNSRFIIEHRPQPAFGLLARHLLPDGIVVHLFLGYLSHGEVVRHWASKVQARDGCRWKHGHRLRQLHSNLLLDVHQLPHALLLRMVWLRWVAGRRTDALVLDLEQIIDVELLVLGISPNILANNLMEFLGKCLGEAIRDCLCHDVVVIIASGLVLLGQLFHAEGRVGKRAHIVHDPRISGGNKVRDAHVRITRLFFCLLSEPVELADNLGPGLVRIYLDVVPNRVGRIQANNADEIDDFLIDDSLQHCLSLVKELLGLCTDSLILEDLRVAPVGVSTPELPHLEEWVPIDIRHHILNRVLLEHSGTHMAGFDWCVLRKRPIHLHLLRLARLEVQIRPVLHACEELVAKLLVLLFDVVLKVLGGAFVQQRLHHWYRPGRIQDVHDGARVLRRNFDGRVHLGRGGTSD